MKKLWIVGLALLAVAAIVLLLCLNQPGTQSNEGTEPAMAPATQPAVGTAHGTSGGAAHRGAYGTAVGTGRNGDL